jgi:hypothetical protein
MNINPITRQQFLQKAVLGGLILPFTLNGQTQQPEKPAPLKGEIVKEFVGVSHNNLDKVKELLGNEPLLLHSSQDWGGGDFESGIEAAGHVGNKEIAAYLLGKGARYNVYLASMLGHLDIVKSVLTFNPGLLDSRGPHGFTMLHHAYKGGEEAKPVVDYLASLGAKVTRFDPYNGSILKTS